MGSWRLSLLLASFFLLSVVRADAIGYQEPVSCRSDADCPPSSCDISRGWVRSFCGSENICQTDVDPCNDHVSCTFDSCDAVKGCQHDTSRCGCSDDGQCYDWNPCTTDICMCVLSVPLHLISHLTSEASNRICRHDALAGCCLDHDDCDVGFRCRTGQCARTKEQINSTCERIAERLMRCCTTVARQPNADGSVTVVNLCKDHPYDPKEEEDEAESPGDINDIKCWSTNGTMVSGNALLGKEIYWCEASSHAGATDSRYP